MFKDFLGTELILEIGVASAFFHIPCAHPLDIEQQRIGEHDGPELVGFSRGHQTQISAGAIHGKPRHDFILFIIQLIVKRNLSENPSEQENIVHAGSLLEWSGPFHSELFHEPVPGDVVDDFVGPHDLLRL